jgi:glycosyltransferase involved in cell wall biosynthesis
MRPKRLLIVQYAGDFREAARRLAAGGPETYRAQRLTVDYVHALAKRSLDVAVLTLFTEDVYDERLESGVRAVGAGYQKRVASADLTHRLDALAPDLMILRTPSRPGLRWAAHRKVRTLALLADSFSGRSVRERLTRAWLVRLLNADAIDIVANHGLNAARQLADAGLRPAKIIPWDFPQLNSPDQHAPKAAPGDPFRLVYVGMLTENKGLWDVVEAVRLMANAGLNVCADIVGRDADGAVRDRLKAVEHADRVMRAADAVVVPSRHAYPEGLPLTIYEALCSRTPLVASDHPMFRSNIVHEESALIFRAGDPSALAEQVQRLMNDADLYARLSRNGAGAWERLQLPVTWDKLIDAWLADDPPSRAWLLEHSLAGYPYPVMTI